MKTLRTIGGIFLAAVMLLSAIPFVNTAGGEARQVLFYHPPDNVTAQFMRTRFPLQIMAKGQLLDY